MESDIRIDRDGITITLPPGRPLKSRDLARIVSTVRSLHMDGYIAQVKITRKNEKEE